MVCQSLVNSQYRLPDSTIAAGNVNTQAISKLRMVFHLQTAAIGHHGHATPDDNMGGHYHGNPNISGADGQHRHGLGRTAGHSSRQVGLADFLAHGHHDVRFPADHGPKPQGDGHGDLHPQRNSQVELSICCLNSCSLPWVSASEMADLVLVHQANGFTAQVHVVTHVADGFGGDFGQGAVAFDFIADLAGEAARARISSGVACLVVT